MIGERNVDKLVENIRECLQEGDYSEANFHFSDLMQQLTPVLLGVARYKGTGEDAKDLVAQTHLAVFEALESNAGINNVKAFSIKVLQHKIIDYIRSKKSKKRQPRAFAAPSSPLDEVPQGVDEESEEDETSGFEVEQPISPDEVSAARNGMEWYDVLEVPDVQANVPFEEWESQTVLNPLLNSLPELEREVLLSRHYFNLSVTDTARRLNLSPDQVKKHCQNAIKMARVAAEKDGVHFEDII